MNVGRLLTETDRDTDLLRVLIHPVQPQRLTLRAASPLMMRMWGTGIQAMTLGSWVFVDPEYLNGDRDRLAKLAIHELVHVRQWRDLGIFGFLGRYLRDYVRGRRNRLSHREAYLEIGLEVEARQVQARIT